MKRKFRAAALLLALIVALGNTTALAADTPETMENSKMTVTPQETDQVTVSLDQENDSIINVTVKNPGSKSYMIVMLQGKDAESPTDSNILYVDQATANDGVLAFQVYPKSIQDGVIIVYCEDTKIVAATVTAKTSSKSESEAATDVKPLTESMIAFSASALTYNGKEQALTYTVTDGSTPLVKGTDYTENVGANTVLTGKNAGDVIKVSITGIGKYTGTVAKSVTIAPKAVEIPSVAQKTYTGKLQSSGLSGTNEYTISSDSVTSATNVGAYTVKAALKSQNYVWSDGSKDEKTITWEIVQATDTTTYTATGKNVTKTYDGKQLSAPTGTAKFNGQKIAGTWSWVTDVTAMVDAGTYTATVLFTPNSGSGLEAKESTVKVTINKAAPTGAPTYTAITQSGRTLASAALSEGTLSPAGGKLIWIDANGHELPSATVVRLDTAYTWQYTTDSNHTTATGTLTPYSSGSSGSSTSTTTTTTDNSKNSTTTNNGSTAAGTTTTDNGKTTTTTTTTNTNATTGVKTETTTQTTTGSDGTVTKNVVETSTTSRGTTASAKTTYSQNGSAVTTVTASVSQADVTNAGGKLITLPTCVSATKAGSIQTAPTVTVTVPANAGSVKVEIPVSNMTSGTVAMTVKANGSTELVKWSAVTDNGLALNVTGKTTVNVVDNSKSFQDTRSHWASDAIAFASAHELFQGTTETTFSPEGEMTRAMLMTVLARLDGVDTSTGENWYDAGMSWAKKKGVSDATAPNSSITREQLAVMLYRYYGTPAVTTTTSGFTDANQVSSWAVNAMNWAVSEGLIQGVGSNTLDPAGPATRAQVAEVLMRYVELRLK